MPSFVTVTPSASSAAVRPAISVFFVLHLIYVDLSLLNASNISSVSLSPNFLRKYPASSSGTEYFTDKYLSVFVLLSGYSILYFSKHHLRNREASQSFSLQPALPLHCRLLKPAHCPYILTGRRTFPE